MQIYIARDGVEIGEYSRTRVEELARDGDLLPNDYYWQDGMADWLLLKDLLAAEIWEPIPPPAPLPFYKHRVAWPIALGAALVLALLLTLIATKSGLSLRRKLRPFPRPTRPRPRRSCAI